MALIQCPECQAQISDTALKCPTCGKQVRKPKRTLMGKLFKWGFILFNAIMLLWLVSGLMNASNRMETLSNEAQRAGATIGTGLGALVIITIWVFGSIILGLFVLFTRPKS